MKSSLGLCCILAVLSTGVVAQESSLENVTTPPPTVGEAQLVGDVLVLQRSLPMFIEEPRTGVRQEGDKQVPYTYNVQRIVSMPSMEAVQASDYRVLDLQGQPLEKATLAERLRTPTAVLFSEERRRLNPIYQPVFKPDTLVVYLRPERPRLPAKLPPPPVDVQPRPSPQASRSADSLR